MFLSRTAYFAATLTVFAATATSALAQEPSAPAPQPVPAPQPAPAPQPGPQTAPPPQTVPKPTPQPTPAPARTPTAPPRMTPPMMPPVMPPPVVKLPAGVAARVNGADLTYDSLVATLKSWGGRPLLERAVQAKVIELEAKKYGATVTAAELKAEIAKAKQGEIDRVRDSGAGMMKWSEIAARNGVSEAFITDNVRTGLLARKTFEKVIAKNIPSIEGQIKVAHILIPTIDLGPPKPDAKAKTPEEEAKRDADAKAEIERILADIVAKKITFEEAAKKYSADKTPDGKGGSAPNGGVLPYAGRNLYDPAFDTAAFGLAKPGDITPAPIKSRVGYHIIKLVQKGANAPEAERVAYRKEQIALQMQNQQAVTQWVQYIMSSAKINYATSAPAPAKKPAMAKPTTTAKTQ